MRLDIYMAENNLAPSRERAKQLIKAAFVKVNGKTCTKPSFDVTHSDSIEADGSSMSYVGRGLLKLEGAFDAFGLDVSGRVCADIGASTGGFTQCMLQRGARLVYAVDVGHDQLHESLARDKRVINMEGVNARYLTPESFGEPPQFMSVDLSFISLTLVMPPLAACLADGGEMAVLIKPQFEAGKAALNKNGLVRDKKDHLRVLASMTELFKAAGLVTAAVVPSSVRGGDGNIEYLAHLKKSESARAASIDLKALVNKAFELDE